MSKTLDYYNENAKEYIENTLNVDMSEIYREFLREIPKNSKILDVGCGSGRDSVYFKNLGYKVTALDGSEEIVKIASEKLNQEVLLMDFKDIDKIGTFQGIWGCASLLHIKRGNLKGILGNLLKNLGKDGIVYMSFKYGDGEFIDSKGRYFNCYNEKTIKELITQVDGIALKKLYITEDNLGRGSIKWLNIFLLKSF